MQSAGIPFATLPGDRQSAWSALRSALAVEQAGPAAHPRLQGRGARPLAARRLRIPCVSTYHAGEPGKGAYATVHGARPAHRAGRRGDRSRKSEYCPQLPGRARVIDNFVSLGEPHRGSDLSREVAFVGRLSPEKGPDIFCALADVLPDLDFAIYGDGPLRESLEPVHPRVRFAGQQPSMAGLWGKIGILCMTSRNEGLPMAALEAMAQGVPVAAFAVGGLPGLIADGRNGWLIPPLDLPAFAAALRRWADLTPAARSALSAAAQATIATRYTADAALPQLLKVYAQAGWSTPGPQAADGALEPGPAPTGPPLAAGPDRHRGLSDYRACLETAAKPGAPHRYRTPAADHDRGLPGPSPDPAALRLLLLFRLHEAFPILFPLKIPKMLSIAAILVLFWNIFITESIKPYWRPELGLLLVFFGLVTIGVPLASNFPIAKGYYTSTYSKIVLMVFVIAWLLRQERDFQLAARMIVVAGMAIAYVAISNKLNGIGLVEGTRVTIGREMRSSLGDPNDLSAVLQFPLSFAIGMLLTPRSGLFNRSVGIAGIVMLIWAILATQSRGALLGVHVGLRHLRVALCEEQDAPLRRRDPASRWYCSWPPGSRPARPAAQRRKDWTHRRRADCMPGRRPSGWPWTSRSSG